MAPVERGWLEFFVDRFSGWWAGFPGERCSYTVETVRIPVGSVKLVANLYRPTKLPPRGTILIRTPYGIGSLHALSNARMFAPRGYQVLVAACRGSDPADGQELYPVIHEVADGHATVAWMREQPWYTGSFATWGGSYLGYTQWALLSDPPPDMKAAVILTGMADFGGFCWRTGAMEAHVLSWADIMLAPKRGVAPGLFYIRRQPQELQPVYDAVPLLDAAKKRLQVWPDWVQQMMTDNTLSGDLWPKTDQRVALERASIPILQITGWNDVVCSTVVDQHNSLVKRNAHTYLNIGPWSHLGAQRGPNLPESFKFIEQYLSGDDSPFRESKSRVFITGSKEWRDLPNWPPSDSMQDFFLASDQALSKNQPSAETSESSFTFDPTSPTPHTGMPRPFDDVIPASYDDTALAQRSDVVSFDSSPLEEDLEVIGRPAIELHHSSDNPHVDVFVRLSEVDSRGKSTRICDGYLRLDPARDSAPLSLPLSDCAHVFSKGARIRVIIAGGAHPAYIRNLGTGENQAYGTTTRPAVHTVGHSAGAASRLRLPVTA